MSTAIQLTSHVLPPSAENACSKRQLSALVDSPLALRHGDRLHASGRPPGAST